MVSNIMVEVIVVDRNDNLLLFIKYMYSVLVLENVFGGF